MPARHQTDLYTNLFNAFCRLSNEKAILGEAIGKIIRDRNVHTLADIGAGDGTLAIPLSQKVKRYIAFEENPRHAIALRTANIQVMRGSFPMEIDTFFDFVLVSHAAPWWPEDYQPFLEAAWRMRARGGAMLVITHDSSLGAWREFLTETGLSTNERNPQRVAGLKLWLARLGTMEHWSIPSMVRGESYEDMSEALAFLYSDGNAEKWQKFVENRCVPRAIESRRKEELYEMPFVHQFLLVT